MKNITRIQPIPEVPEQIIQAVNDKKLAIFIGAGVSRLIGCSGWDKLASDLVDACFKNEYINFKEKETLNYLNDQKKIITMCYGILKSKEKEEIFYERMEDALKGDPEKVENQNIYNEISDFKALYITTNADRHFDCKFMPNNIEYKLEDFITDNLSTDKLYHIHGSIDYKESLVFTVDQYIKRYNDKMFVKFMTKIMQEYTILFIGYGLAEFEILDFLITKFYEENLKKPKHYALIPYYKGEENICEYEQFYYERLGINILPYAKDKLGYEQLYEVMKEWRKKINVLSIVLPESFKNIKKSVECFDESNVNNILQLIKNNKAQENEFFESLSISNNPSVWLKELHKNEYFAPNKNLIPLEDRYQKNYYSIPRWNILNYLINVSNKNKQNNDENITNILIDIIDNIINYRDEKGERIENFRTDDAIIKIIMDLPQGKIKQDYIEFIGIAINSKWNNGALEYTLTKYDLAEILDKKQMLHMLDIILDNNLKVKSYWFQKLLDKNKKTIGKLYPYDAVEVALKKIQNVINENSKAFFYFKIETIENIEKYMEISYENQLISFARDMLQYSNLDNIVKSLQEMITNNNSIYRRLAIHAINYHYNEEVKDIFFKLSKNPLDDYESEHEVHRLLNNRCKLFSNEEIDIVLNWIENKNYYIPEYSKNDKITKKKVIAYQKKLILHELLDSQNSKVIKLYKKYDEINPTPIEEQEKKFGETFRYVSPVELEELEKKRSKDICQFLNEFKGGDYWADPSERGLAEVLEKYVISNFSKFIEYLDDYYNIPTIYLNSIINGLKKMDLLGNTIYIDKILNFLENLLEKIYFNLEDEEAFFSLISLITFLYVQLLKSTDDNRLLMKIKLILINIIKNVKEEKNENSDCATSPLSTVKGHGYIGLIEYSLRLANIKYSNQESKLENDVKRLFTENLNKNNEMSISYSAVLGMHLPALMYLDKQWVAENFNKIFDEKLEDYWKSAMENYLDYSKFYLDIYMLMKEYGCYCKAIDTKFNDRNINDKLIQHICIGYLNTEESIKDDNSLIVKLINKKDTKDLEQIIWFISTGENEKLNSSMKLKIKELWEELINAIEDIPVKEESPKLLFKLCNWINLIDNLDEDIFKWITKYIKYCRYNYETHFIMKGLLKHVVNEPAKVANIYLTMIENEIYPTEEEEIKKIAEILYNNGMKKEANQICNSYLASGIKFLQEIYDEFNKND